LFQPLVFDRSSDNVDNIVKIPLPTLHGFIFMCISIDYVGLLLREGGRDGAGPFDIIQYCYNQGEGEGRLPYLYFNRLDDHWRILMF
jgi:hypothetical protein